MQRWDTRQKNLLVILARDVASKLATPMFVVDGDGTLVYFNEAAEPLLGESFADAGEKKREEWWDTYAPIDAHGARIPFEHLPLGIALTQGRPAHKNFRIRGTDGIERPLASTAIPLLAHQNDIVGAVALFWKEPHEEGS